MKVLIVFNDTDTDNLFVHILYSKLKQQIEIECSLDNFWNSNSNYDIIHFQWPEEVIGWNCTDFNQIDKLKERIAYFKSKGSKFVYTRHNIQPHYANKVISEAYKLIEINSSAVVHMGNYSLNEYKAKYPNSYNLIIPHHIYENAYNENISKDTARAKLGISPDKFVITSFGKFRNMEERNMMLKTFFKLKIKNKYLLVPRFFPFHNKPTHASRIKRIISKIAYHTFIPFFKMLRICGGGIDDIVSHDDLPYYLLSSDVIFVQRKHILNSGNVPLGFMFKKIVIGPSTGNVGEILLQTGNPTFNPNNINSITKAIEKAAILHSQKQGEKNYEFAIKYMNLNSVAQQYIDVYNFLIREKNS